MIRTFHPIGQGAFYTEEFGNFTVVYDCGSLTGGSKNGKKLIEKGIDETFGEKKEIDAVFISHLHADHVNGLEYLLTRCNVKRLFLPLIDNEEKIYLHISNVIYGNNDLFLNALIDSPQDAVKGKSESKCKVYFVPPIKKVNINLKNGEVVDFEQLEEQNYKGQILNINIKLVFEKIKAWVFIPFNFKLEERCVELRELLKEKFSLFSDKSGTLDVNRFKKIWKNKKDRDEIKRLNKCISQDLNINSMTLYSGPEGEGGYSSKLSLSLYENRWLPGKYELNLFSGCLYFGDYNAKKEDTWQALTAFYENYWEKIEVVQIPHHGSKHNYRRDINKESKDNKSKICIISAGKSNQYKHPSPYTIADILKDSGWPVKVTEDPTSIVVQEIRNTDQLQPNDNNEV